MVVTKDTVIMEVLRADMETANIFTEAGMHCLGWGGAAYESIGDACGVHGVDADSLVAKLNAHFGK